MRCNTTVSGGGPKGAFSLTEVVLALAVFSLAIVSLLGLLSVAMSSQRDSVMETTAANVASAILNQRRAAPEATGAGIILPKLSDMSGTDPTGGASGEEIVDVAGKRVSENDLEAQFLCQYRGWGWDDPTTPGLVRVHLRLMWPVELARRDPERAEKYEVFTMISGR